MRRVTRLLPSVALVFSGEISLATAVFAQEHHPGPPGEAPPRVELPLTIAPVDTSAPRAGAGRLRVTIDTNPISDTLLQRRGGRLRVAVFTGSGASRVLDSRIDRAMPFDVTVDQWVLELPVHWSSRDTWIAVEAEETGSGARGRTMIDLPSSPSFSNPVKTARPVASTLPMTLELSDVKRTPFGSTGRLNLTIQTALFSKMLEKTAQGRLRIVVFEKTGAGNSIAMPVHRTFPVSLESGDWSTTLPLRWSTLASALSVDVEETATGIRGAGSIRVRPE